MNLAGPVAARDRVFSALASGRADEPTDTSTPLTDQEIVAAARSISLAAGGEGTAAARLVADLMDPDIEISTVSRRIEACPGITVRILRVANSAFYRQSGTIATVARAVHVLGLTTLKGIAAAACLDHMVVAPADASVVDMDEFRRHCIATACAAQALARATGPEHIDDAFVAGLLHDLGLIVQWRLRPAGLSRLRLQTCPDDPERHPETRRVLEPRYTGTTHAHCTRVLLAAWNLPPALVTAVAAHDSPDDVVAAAGPLATLVAAGDMLAADAGYGLGSEPVDDDHDLRLADYWSAHEEARIAVVALLPDAVNRLCAVFDA